MEGLKSEAPLLWPPQPVGPPIVSDTTVSHLLNEPPLGSGTRLSKSTAYLDTDGLSATSLAPDSSRRYSWRESQGLTNGNPRLWYIHTCLQLSSAPLFSLRPKRALAPCQGCHRLPCLHGRGRIAPLRCLCHFHHPFVCDEPPVLSVWYI
jgi:hypothetical protein